MSSDLAMQRQGEPAQLHDAQSLRRAPSRQGAPRRAPKEIALPEAGRTLYFACSYASGSDRTGTIRPPQHSRLTVTPPRRIVNDAQSKVTRRKRFGL